MSRFGLTLPTPEELGMSAADYGDMLHGLPPWMSWDDDEVTVVTPAAPDDAENPLVHLSHGCVTEPFPVSLCQIALNEAPRGPAGDGDITVDDLCPACVSAYQASPLCPICSRPLDAE